jgi:thiol-disulfide isomerase/thioredoxin
MNKLLLILLLPILIISCKNKKSLREDEDINIYLAQKEMLVDSLSKLEDYHYYGQLEEKEYLKLMDSIYNLKIKFIDKNFKHLDKEFVFLEKSTFKYQKLSNLALYEQTRRMLTEDENFKVSSKYYTNLFKGIDLSDERLAGISDYINFVDSYFWRITKNQLEDNDSTDFYLTYIDYIARTTINKEIRQALSYNVGKYKLSRTKELDKVYTKIKGFITDTAYINEIEQKYKTLKKIEKGAVSPSFSFNDINGDLVSLKDLKGQIVFIDIWSTTCLPCMAEIPYLKALQDEFKNEKIKFISINVIDSIDTWKKEVKEKQLGGILLHSSDNKDSFFKDYLVRGIPRFILLDKDGKIIDSSAKRPSDPKLKEQLKGLI